MKKRLSLLLVLAMLLSCLPLGVFAAEDAVYTVAGFDTLCGTAWNPGDMNNQMTLNEEGLYEKYYMGVPAGTYEFKVTDGTWNKSWGMNGNNCRTFHITDRIIDMTAQ